MLTIAVPVLVGLTIAAQSFLLGTRGGSTSPVGLSLALTIAGTLAGVVWATTRRRWGEVVAVSGQWWWLPLGVAGWLIVAALGWSAARLGVAAALAIVVAAQLTGGLALDVLSGRVRLSASSVAGVAVVCVGVLLILRGR
jgi:uncharacterized membrane protein YdcZ (DUF606 family)